jgi:hypothetical protein
MRKLFMSILIAMLLVPFMSVSARGGHGGHGHYHGHGGGWGSGVAAGFVGGAIVGSAVSSDSGRSSRAEAEARDAQRRVDQLKSEQQQEKFADIKLRLEREEMLKQQEAMLKQQQEMMAQKESLEQSNRMTIIFLILAFFFLLGLIAMGVVMARRRP